MRVAVISWRVRKHCGTVTSHFLRVDLQSVHADMSPFRYCDPHPQPLPTGGR